MFPKFRSSPLKKKCSLKLIIFIPNNGKHKLSKSQDNTVYLLTGSWFPHMMVKDRCFILWLMLFSLGGTWVTIPTIPFLGRPTTLGA